MKLLNDNRRGVAVGGFKLYAHHLTGYMNRWIFRTPWGALRIHHILRSDDDRHLHDHPFDFWSLLLTNGYREWGPLTEPKYGGAVRRDLPRWSLVKKKAEDAHRLELLDGPVWTFVWTGPKYREWGFWTPDGWVHWKDYFGYRNQGENST